MHPAACSPQGGLLFLLDGYVTHLPPPITVHVVLLHNLDAFALSERHLIFMFRQEIMQCVDVFWHDDAKALSWQRILWRSQMESKGCLSIVC